MIKNLKENININNDSEIINVASNSSNETEAKLSNLSYSPFIIDWKKYASVEAFWQWLKFPEKEKRLEIAGMSWILSKKIWNDAPKCNSFFYEWVEYKVWSTEHQSLMKKAIKCKLEQNPDILELLLATGNKKIIHIPTKKDWTPYPESKTIPWEVFSLFLMELRDEFWSIEKVIKITSNNIWGILNKLDILLSEISSVFRDHWGEPLNISYYRENWYQEINNYLLDILKKLYSLYEEMWLNQRWYFSSSLVNYITFDNEAKLYLHNHLSNRLVENLWNLYYNTLADFLEELSKISGNEKLKIASDKIRVAWGISKLYVDKNNPPQKHENAEFEIELFWWVNTITERVWKMENTELWTFLLELSQKIWNDWEKDSKRPSIWKDWIVNETKTRTKLATALFEASFLIKSL